MTMPTDATQPPNNTDEYAGSLPQRLPKDVLVSLSQVSGARFLARVALEWALFIGAAWLCDRFWNPLLYFLTVLWIGARMNALSVLMHEATHYRAVKSRWLNDALGELLLAWPLGITLHGYRNNHFLHHRYLNTEMDPDWVRNRPPQFQFPTTRKKIYFELVKYLLFINLPYEMKQAKGAKELNDVPPRIKAGRAVFLLTAIGLSIYFDLWKQLLLYWAVPVTTSFLLFIFLRSVAEHYGGFDYDHPLSQTRTVIPTWWEKLLVGPHNINYHLEHHLYPSVPCHNLPKLHQELMRDAAYREKARITKGYMSGVMAEVEWSNPRPHAAKIR